MCFYECFPECGSVNVFIQVCFQFDIFIVEKIQVQWDTGQFSAGVFVDI